MYNIYMQISELSYNLLKTTIYTLSAQLSNLEKLVPQPPEIKNSVENYYLGLNSKSQTAMPKCHGSLYTEHCENIYYDSGKGDICKQFYMQWDQDGIYCKQYFSCKEKKNEYYKSDKRSCGVDLDTSCNMQDISGVWRQFI